MVAHTTPRNDPNIKIPSAVQRLAAEAEAAFHAVNGAPPAEAPVDAPAEPAPVAAEVAPVTPEVTPAAPAPVAAPDWEHAFKSMKGRYDSAQNSLRDLSAQVASFQARIAELEARPAEVAPELRPESFLTPEETSEYGVEFLDVVGKKALEKISPEMAALKKELAALKGHVEGSAAATAANARNAMNKALDENIPSWREVNVAQEFHSWLALPDPMSGAIRHSLLSAAYEQNNTPRVAAIFNGFLAHEAALAPAPPAEPDLEAIVADKIPLASLAAPGRAKTAAAPGAPVEKPIFSTAQISKFYADVAAGRYRGKEAEYNRIDAQIVEAGREGRVR